MLNTDPRDENDAVVESKNELIGIVVVEADFLHSMFPCVLQFDAPLNIKVSPIFRMHDIFPHIYLLSKLTVGLGSSTSPEPEFNDLRTLVSHGYETLSTRTQLRGREQVRAVRIEQRADRYSETINLLLSSPALVTWAA